MLWVPGRDHSRTDQAFPCQGSPGAIWPHFGVHIRSSPAWIQLLLCLHGDLSCFQLTDCIGRGSANRQLSLNAFLALSFLDKGLWADGTWLPRLRPSTAFYDSGRVMILLSAPKILLQSDMMEEEAFSAVGPGSHLFQAPEKYLLRGEESLFSRDLLVQNNYVWPTSWIILPVHKLQLPTSIFF